MRVIAGTYRSRPIVAPRGLGTRPTSGRLRETLFNVLGARIEGAFFADLYAGSGAAGIEALSRGAAHVSFVENAAAAVSAIRANLASLGIRSGFRIDPRPVSAALRRLAGFPAARPWDVVFLDPPYQDAGAYESTLTALGQPGLLAPGGVVVAEHQKRRRHESLAESYGSYGSLHRFRVIEQGDAALSLYQIPKPQMKI